MITQSANLNTENLYSSNRLDIVKEKSDLDKPVEEKVSLKVPKDDVTISESGNIDFTLFNFLDKGGDASKTLSEGQTNDAKFTVTPNFANLSASRYAQMKAEIERNFADDPSSKGKYAKELDKALKDYTQLQEKINDALNSKEGKKLEFDKTTEDETTKTEITKDETTKAETTKAETTKDETTKTEAEDDKTEDDKAAQSKAVEEEMKLYKVDDEVTKEIIEKIFGTSENNYPDEISKVVDDFFVNTFKQKTDSAKIKNTLNQENKDPKIRQVWDTIKFQGNVSE